MVLTVASFSSRALACPGSYSTLHCDDPGTDVCQSSAGIIVCDLTRDDPEEGGTITAVLMESSLCGGDYCAWGEVYAADVEVSFCCPIEITDETGLRIVGTDYNDTISFQYSTSYDLSHYTTGWTFDGQAVGGPGDDTITGSRDNTSWYDDELNGNGGSDTIDGDLGDDEISGESEADILVGGVGFDTIYGGLGDDQITGDDGDDFLYGGGDDDTIDGGIGVDIIRGDAGEDTLCGDDGSDDIQGGDDADTLWGGGGGSDVGNGGDPTTAPGDACDGGTIESTASCESTTSFSEPAACTALH